jgi:tRNA-specific 2-thiouridylase
VGETGETVEIELLDPAYGIAPGQAAVLYDGTRVVGSATIASTQRATAGRRP